MKMDRNQMLMIAAVLVIVYLLMKDNYKKKSKYAGGACPYCKG
jgi:hypothetical protein